MNKDDFERIDKLAAVALNEIGNEDFDRVDVLKIGQLLRINKTFIDVARQLTIANEIAIRKAEAEGIWKVTDAKPTPPNALVAVVEGQIRGMAYIIKNPAHLEDNIRHWHDKLDNALAAHQQGKPLPKTDDALVEAVKRFVGEAEAVVDEDMRLCDYDISVSSFKRLEAAYAAHEKPGDSNAT